mmetsp:Transcript_15738/g.47756  ORF Transcript_15738/g.47756 Transcript_15738/m.47756 type:complete len:223 (-) Transcript_15738:463-1131(-)|eukprot:scaffold127821_cov35-Tisochrysis_lutea.AAC.2
MKHASLLPHADVGAERAVPAGSSLLQRKTALLHLLRICLKVIGVQVVYPDVPVLATTGICPAMWRKSERVHRTEVASYASQLLAKRMIEKDRLKLTLLRGRCRDGHSVLTSTSDHVGAVGQRREGSRIEGPLRIEGVQEPEGLDLKEADKVVGTGGAHQRLVPGELQVRDFLCVHPFHDMSAIAILRIPHSQRCVIRNRVDGFIERAPQCARDVARVPQDCL